MPRKTLQQRITDRIAANIARPKLECLTDHERQIIKEQREEKTN